MDVDVPQAGRKVRPLEVDNLVPAAFRGYCGVIVWRHRNDPPVVHGYGHTGPDGRADAINEVAVGENEGRRALPTRTERPQRCSGL